MEELMKYYKLYNFLQPTKEKQMNHSIKSVQHSNLYLYFENNYITLNAYYQKRK